MYSISSPLKSMDAAQCRDCVGVLTDELHLMILLAAALLLAMGRPPRAHRPTRETQ